LQACRLAAGKGQQSASVMLVVMVLVIGMGVGLAWLGLAWAWVSSWWLSEVSRLGNTRPPRTRGDSGEMRLTHGPVALSGSRAAGRSLLKDPGSQGPREAK
jgi:hypothetical protein